MNGFDIAILAILVAFLVKGLLQGLLKEVCSLAGLVIGTVLAFTFHPALAGWLQQALGLPGQLATAAAFFSLLLVAVLVFSALGFVLSRFVKLIFLGGINRVAGAGFGMVQGVVLLALVLFALTLGPLPEGMKRSMQGSELAPPFVDLGESIFIGGRQLWEQR